MESRTANPETLRAAERAAEWLCVLEDAGADELARFADWVRESPLHAREFLLMSAVDGELTRMDPQRRLEIGELLAAAGSNIVALAPAPAPASASASASAPRLVRAPRFPLPYRWVVAAAALVVSAMVAWWSVGTARSYETAAGEQRALVLADGSSIQLGMKSRIEVSLTVDARAVTLLEGEAMFMVAHEPGRPFSVRAGSSVIQAIGTQFNVNRRPSSTTVSVVEGKVQISAGNSPKVSAIRDGGAGLPTPGNAAPRESDFARLAAGEEVRIGNDGRIERRGTIDPLDIASWRHRPLVFRDEALEDIAADFNRHNRTARIFVEGDAVRTRRYTAVFDAGDPQSLMQFLREENQLEVRVDGERLIVRERSP